MDSLLIALLIGYLIYREVSFCALRTELKDLNRRLGIVASDRLKWTSADGESHEGKFISIAILGSLFLVVLSTYLTVVLVGHGSLPSFFEFASYVLPGLAASTAGLGLYWRRDESFYFLSASFMVLLGFVCFLIFKMDDLKTMIPGTSVGWAIFVFSISLISLLLSILVIVKNRAFFRFGAQLSRQQRREKRLYIILLVISVFLLPVFFLYRKTALWL
ncbi:hypothetical protein SAMN02800694_2621 [Luteibacter sp. UNCMF331Sha3.1]|uniref:hypothetical protein n=1 Tax=Luteibacter sp. UNCMF331Sha3.1 TaxID=1502760 RepID=UPI0008AD6EBA|nr:hypothetical protein [Luteibacter sp. UNCMF331Sha3.1]SEN05362.1 hypothetical protein SAMN02800694_2621 [Luteibacter sp. UNCMF331Sha3.1]